MRRSKSVPALPAGVEFRPVVGFPRYVAGEDGTVFAKVRTGNRWVQVLGSGKGRNVAIRNDRGTTTVTLAKLVTLAWCGPRPDGAGVQFKDGNPRNVRPYNLCWGPSRSGRPPKLPPGQRAFIRDAVKGGKKPLLLAKRFGISEDTARNYAKGNPS